MNRRTRARKPVARRLTTWLAARILEHVRLNELPPGAHITEQALADRFRVSRAPVRLALPPLARRRAVEHRPNRGFYLAASVSDSRAEVPPEMEEDRLYYGIAEDRLAGRLSERVTESELARKYGATRPRVHGVVSRMAQEGWLQRLPGHGWVF